MSKYFVIPSTTGCAKVSVAIQISSTLEQSVKLAIDGVEIGLWTGSGDDELARWDLAPGAPRDCQVDCSHRQPGQEWIENEYAGPVLKQVADVRALEILSYDRSRPIPDGANVTVSFSWW